jgi:hypothetical protein
VEAGKRILIRLRRLGMALRHDTGTYPQLREDELHLRPGFFQVVDLREVDRQLRRRAIRRLDVAVLRKKVGQHLPQKALIVDLGVTADGVLDAL